MKKLSHIQAKQKKITEMATSRFEKYYLSGGTALSFYLSHRSSEDLDFFPQKYDKKEPDMMRKILLPGIEDSTGWI